MSAETVVGAGTLDELATQFTNAATGLRAIDLATPVDGVGTALPGSQTAMAASTVAVRLASSAEALAERVDALAATATATGQSYSSVDGGAAGRLVAR